MGGVLTEREGGNMTVNPFVAFVLSVSVGIGLRVGFAVFNLAASLLAG